MPVHLYDVPKSVTPFKDKGIKTAINGKSVFVPLLPPVVVCKIFKWGYSIYILFMETKIISPLSFKKNDKSGKGIRK